MGAPHYTTTELAEMVSRAAVDDEPGDHVSACEQCHWLLALVRRARGEPSAEQKEVTVDALRRLAAQSPTGDSSG